MSVPSLYRIFMEYPSQEKTDIMGQLHNGVVALIDAIELSPPEVIIVLRMITNNIERLFEASLQREK